MKRVTLYPELKPRWGIPYSRQHLSRLEKAGKFPKRVPLGENTIAWLDDELEAHIDACAAARDGDNEAA